MLPTIAASEGVETEEGGKAEKDGTMDADITEETLSGAESDCEQLGTDEEGERERRDEGEAEKDLEEEGEEGIVETLEVIGCFSSTIADSHFFTSICFASKSVIPKIGRAHV